MKNDENICKKLMYGSDFYLTEVEKLRTKHHIEFLTKTFEDSPEQWLRLTSGNTRKYLFD